jgi:extracellular elastinolytic metalloproteinase
VRRPLIALVAAGALAAGLTAGPSATAAPTVDPLGYGFQGEGGLDAETADLRAGLVAPTAAQRAAVEALGARATWNAFGTPKVLTRDDAGYLSAPADGAPADVARRFVRDNAALFGLTEALTVPSRLELVKAVPLAESPQLRRQMARQPVDVGDNAHVVTFQQVFEGAPTGIDGLLTVGLDPQGRVAWASASTTRDTEVTNRSRISMVDAYLAAAKDARIDVARDDIELLEAVTPLGSRILKRDGVADQQTVRLVAVPTPRDGVRLAFEAVVLRSTTDGVEHPHAYLSMVDAQTGRVLHRSNRLQHSDDSADAPGSGSVPYWKVFPNFPQLPKDGVVTPDDRQYWCFVGGPDCARVLGPNGDDENVASPYAYDELLTPDGTPYPSFRTEGNNARTAISRVSQLTPDTLVPAASATRQYDFAFTDQWQQSKCDPASFASPGLNDADAATANLFVMHNRMHDWGYFLGWTEQNSNLQYENAGSEADTPERENDPEIGNAQSGSVSGGATFLGRDNANQVTLRDGTPGITNQYLWEPLQAGFYPPCVDGAYDMGIVGHEVGHAISNRMTAGPDQSLSGDQSGSMGESWSDLMAMEYLNGYGYEYGTGIKRYSIAAYAVGDDVHGIRSYNMADSPLNFSDIDYDGNGTTSPHADGEIWSATQFDVRKALVTKYEAAGFDADDRALQARCADGLLASTDCPGNRRWIQLLFDGYLLQPAATSMLDSRDAIIAADKLRYGGANQKELWQAFAKRGMGADATTESANDHEPEAGFRDPVGTNGTVRFQVSATGAALPEETRVHVGAFEARTTPVATLDGGAASAARRFTPGTYRLYVVAPGFGHLRTTMTVAAGETKTVTIPLRRNHASAEAGAEATGDGDGFAFLIDDSEGTNWASIGEGDIRGKQVTVALAGGRQVVREVQVSAMNRPALCDGPTGDNPFETVPGFCSDGDEAPYDTGGQNRFAALRSFEILTCDTTTGKACEEEGDFTSRLVAKDAFPADRPRPTVKDLALRTFAIADTPATHVRIKVVDNQCTGGPLYTAAANPENNPLSAPDCTNGMLTTASAAGAPATTTNNTQVQRVRIAELQVFSSRTAAAPVVQQPPVVTPPVAQPRPTTPTLPTTGGLPVALLAVGLLAGAAVVHRVRRTA